MLLFSFLRRRADAFALFALALVCALAFWPLLRGQAFYHGDLQLYFVPMATFWKGQLMQGRVPLWNAGILGGTPFVGNPQMWVLYPSALLLLAFPAVTALMISALSHFWMTGAFFYGWMRRGSSKMRPLAALLGAITWMLCGFVVAKSQFPNMLQAIAWVPAVLWAGEAVAARPKARTTLVLASVLALQLLAAHAQIGLFSGYMLLIYGFYRWRIMPLQMRASGWRVTASFVGALLLAGALSLGQLLPIMEALGATARQDLGVYQASRFALIPWAIPTLVAPHFYGDPMRGVWNYPANVNLWESACYLGLVPLALAIVALRYEARARFWASWTAGFLWLSMGVWGGLWVLAYHALPGVSRFHDAGRFLVGFSLGGALLAALGANWISTKARNGARWTLLALALTALDLGIYARGFYPTTPLSLAQSAPPPPWGTDELIEARQARIWTVESESLWQYYQPITDFRPGNFANTRRYYAIAPPNRHLMNGWLAEVGYEPMYDRATRDRMRALDANFGGGQFPPRLAAQLARNSVCIVQIPRATPLPATPDWTLLNATTVVEPDGKNNGGLKLWRYRNERCLPRARWHDGNGKWQRAPIARETASSIELAIPAEARTVELADAMRPGWSARLDDGSPLRIETTSEGWRRLQLPPQLSPQSPPNQAARRVRFEYAPQTWKLGVFVSLCALGFTCAGLMVTRRNRG